MKRTWLLLIFIFSIINNVQAQDSLAFHQIQASLSEQLTHWQVKANQLIANKQADSLHHYAAALQMESEAILQWIAAQQLYSDEHLNDFSSNFALAQIDMDNNAFYLMNAMGDLSMDRPHSFGKVLTHVKAVKTLTNKISQTSKNKKNAAIHP